MKANANIKSVTQSIKNAKATMEKVKWQQDQKIVEQQKVENDLDLVLEDMQQISDAKVEMRERLDMFLQRDKKTVTLEEEDQKLFDEITTQLDTVDDKQDEK